MSHQVKPLLAHLEFGRIGGIIECDNGKGSVMGDSQYKSRWRWRRAPYIDFSPYQPEKTASPHSKEEIKSAGCGLLVLITGLVIIVAVITVLYHFTHR